MKGEKIMQRLTQQDEKALKAYLNKDTSNNLFFLGDLEMFGFDHPKFLNYYGTYNHQGNFLHVLMQYQQHLHLVADTWSEDATQFLLTMAQKYSSKLNVSASTLQRLQQFNIQFSSIKKTMLLVYQQIQPMSPAKNYTAQKQIEPLSLQDIDSYLDLLQTSFPDSLPRNKEMLIQQHEKKQHLIYVIKENNKIVSTATATAFSQDAAMIISVATCPSARGNGYASAIVEKLCQDLLQDGKRAVLFYDNPVAGRIYEKIGFRYHSDYFMTDLQI